MTKKKTTNRQHYKKNTEIKDVVFGKIIKQVNMAEIAKYIESFPEDVQKILRKIRKIIKKTTPDADEKIAYGMPGYKTFGKPLVYFAGYKNHIGFYATPTGHEEFEKELSQFKQGKGSVQFPLNKPIPYDLISKIVKFRKKENEMKYGT